MYQSHSHRVLRDNSEPEHQDHLGRYPDGYKRHFARPSLPVRSNSGVAVRDAAPSSWHDSYVLGLLVLAALGVVAVVVFVARGYGGELSTERSDYLELELGPVSATDVALLRPPMTLWGYSMQATDEALERIAASIRERDVRIVALEQLVTDLTREPAAPPLGSPYGAPRHRRAPFEPVPPPPEQSHD